MRKPPTITPGSVQDKILGFVLQAPGEFVVADIMAAKGLERKQVSGVLHRYELARILTAHPGPDKTSPRWGGGLVYLVMDRERLQAIHEGRITSPQLPPSKGGKKTKTTRAKTTTTESDKSDNLPARITLNGMNGQAKPNTDPLRGPVQFVNQKVALLLEDADGEIWMAERLKR